VIVVGMVKDDSFLKLADELGIRHHFVIVGAVPHEEIKDYLAIADVETHDLDGLGLGITSVEAMDAGVPIVAWAVDDNFPQYSLRSYGPSGLIDDGSPETIANKVIQIISDESYRSTILESQRRLVDEIYSCKSVTDQYLKLLET
jgi:glycosyltransferase involved in cell wall biosynthesis